MNYHMRALALFIRESRNAAKLTQDQLASEAECVPSYINKLEAGKALPSPRMIERLNKALRLPPGRLANMVIQARYHKVTPTMLAEEHPASQEHGPKPGYSSLPMLSSCPASAAKFTEDEVMQWIEFPESIVRGRRMYLLKIVGDSMDRSLIEDGDVVLVDADRNPENGDICIVRIDRDECTAKRFYRTNGTITLMPDSHNPTHTPITITKKADVLIRGVVEAVWMKRLK